MNNEKTLPQAWEKIESVQTQVVGFDEKIENKIKQRLITANTIEELKTINSLKEGDVVEVLGYYSSGDGAGHKRVIANGDDGSGVQLSTNLWANIVHNGEVNVSWFGAKQNINEDQSSYIQKAINWFSKCSKIVIDKTYQIDNSISFPYNSNNIKIIGYGGILKYTGTDTALKLEITRNHEITNHPQYIYIKGLKIEGNYKGTGISIKQFNNWKLEDIQVYGFLNGIVLSDTYYGEISGKSTILCCLTGIKFESGTESIEVNTIKLDNIGIKNGIEKTNFIPKNLGESEEEYNSRVISKGIHINSLIMGCKFTGLTIEAHDYGVYSSAFSDDSGANASIYTIQECYFEAIKLKNIYINNYIEGKQIIYGYINIYNNRFYEPSKPIDIDIGCFNIFGNQEVDIILSDKTDRRLVLNTDIKIDAKYASTFKMCRVSYMPTNTDIDSFLGSNPYPNDLYFLKTFEKENKIIVPRDASYNMELYQKYISSMYQMAFLDRNNSVILKGDDNNFYSLFYQEGKLRTKLTNNEYLVYPPANIKTAIYAQKNIGKYAEGEKIKILELGKEVVKKGNVWTYDNDTVSLIGTAEYYSKNSSSRISYDFPVVYNSETGFMYSWQNGFWSWCSSSYVTVYKTNFAVRAIGNTSERPNLLDESIENQNVRKFFVYYNTDTKKYEMVKDNQWVEWDKIVRIDTDDYYDNSLPTN